MITYFLRYSETRVLILTIIMLALIIQTNIVVLLTIRNNFRRNLIVEYGKFVGILFISILILLKFVEIFLQYTKSNYIVYSNIFFVTSTIIVLIILIRGPIELYKIINEGDSFLSNMSIREVIDNLDTGILIYTKEGSIILINEKMKKLLKLYYGDVKRDGKEIWKDLNNFCDSQALTCIKLQNSQIFRLEDISYEFSIDEITVDDEVYSQVLAFDVTERDKKIQILENKNNELSRLVSEYEIMKKNIQEIVEESVKLHLKMNLHDTLGHYLSMIQAVTASERYTEISLEKLNLFDVLDIYKLDSEQLPEAKLIDMKTFLKKLAFVFK